MLNVVKALILVAALMIVFLPMGPARPLLGFLSFAFSMGLVYLYWRLSYWVSEKAAVDALAEGGHETGGAVRSRFVGKVSPDPSEDLARGRLVFTEGEIVLVQRNLKRKKGEPLYQATWSLPKDKVESLGFGKVAGSRKGFVVCAGEGEVKFVSSRFCGHHSELFEAMGWNEEEGVGNGGRKETGSEGLGSGETNLS